MAVAPATEVGEHTVMVNHSMAAGADHKCLGLVRKVDVDGAADRRLDKAAFDLRSAVDQYLWVSFR